MTTNKPEVVGYITTKSGVLLGGDDGFSTTDFSDQLAHRNPGGIAAEPVIRLSDYEALQAECEQLRKDAERYRWLREQCGNSGLLTIAKVGAFELKAWSGDDPDTAIDAAMAGGEA